MKLFLNLFTGKYLCAVNMCQIMCFHNSRTCVLYVLWMDLVEPCYKEFTLSRKYTWSFTQQVVVAWSVRDTQWRCRYLHDVSKRVKSKHQQFITSKFPLASCCCHFPYLLLIWDGPAYMMTPFLIFSFQENAYIHITQASMSLSVPMLHTLELNNWFWVLL